MIAPSLFIDPAHYKCVKAFEYPIYCQSAFRTIKYPKPAAESPTSNESTM